MSERLVGTRILTVVRKRIHDLAMGAALASLTRGHRVLHRISAGRLGRHFPGGQQVVWISTLGRRSDTWRRTPLLAVDDGAGAYVVAGSNAGQERIPGWVFNIGAHPEGFLEVDGAHWRVHFREATGADRDELYARLVASFGAFAGYQRRAERAIPVFRVVLDDPVRD